MFGRSLNVLSNKKSITVCHQISLADSSVVPMIIIVQKWSSNSTIYYETEYSIIIEKKILFDSNKSNKLTFDDALHNIFLFKVSSKCRQCTGSVHVTTKQLIF